MDDCKSLNILKAKIISIVNRYSKGDGYNLKNINYDSINKLLNKAFYNSKKNIVIGITGETASGKTALSKTISEVTNILNIPSTFLTSDNYFKDISNLLKNFKSFDDLVLNGYDIDSPNSSNLDLLKKDIINLSNGIDIYSPKYLLNGTGISVPNSIYVKANKIIIAEGIAIGYGDIHNFIDLLLYVEIDDNLRKQRFIKRSAERSQSAEMASKYWDYVTEAGKKYVKPIKEKADIIICGDGNLNNINNIIKILFNEIKNLKISL